MHPRFCSIRRGVLDVGLDLGLLVVPPGRYTLLERTWTDLIGLITFLAILKGNCQHDLVRDWVTATGWTTARSLVRSDWTRRLWFPLAKPSRMVWRIFSTVDTLVVDEPWLLLARPSRMIWRIFSTVDALVVDEFAR